MDRPGEKLKRARERLKLTYRDVEKASQNIAQRRGSDEFSIALSRLADIEHKGTVPTIFRLYTLSAIYRLDFTDVLGWYGVPLEQLPHDAQLNPLNETHAASFAAPSKNSTVQLPPEIDLNSTTFLSHLSRRGNKTGLLFLSGWDLRQHRYGFIGLEDWSMFPVLRPGSLVLIDEPELHLHTHWQAKLLEMLQGIQRRRGGQIILATQSGDLFGFAPDHSRLLLRTH